MIAPKALSFDCDGTLALTADLHFTAFQAALALQGQTMSRVWYEARTGLARHDLFAALQAETGAPLDLDRAVADSIALTLTGTQVCRPNPPVADLARRWQGHPIAVASNAEAPVVIFDVPLLFETGGQRAMDKVVVVSAAPEVQRARVLARPGMTAEAFERILARQLPDADKRARADFVIATDRGLEAARADVLSLIDRIRQEPARA